MGRGPDRTPRRPRRHHAADHSGLPDWVFALQRWGQGVPYAYDVWLEPTWNDDAGHWQGIVATLHVVGTDVYVDPVVVVDMRSERAKRRSKNRRVMADLSLPLRAHITNPDLPTRIQQLCKTTTSTTAPASTSP